MNKAFFPRAILNAVLLFVLEASISSCGSKTLAVKDEPSTVIKSENSGLGHPEGVAFSQDGDFIAVANAEISTVSFYKRIGNKGAVYETVPFFTLKNPVSQLNYPHDVSFSPDGRHLAVANTASNSINIYKKSSDDAFYDPTPIAVFKGDATRLHGSHAVKYAPLENIIAVANVWANTIMFFRYEDDQYEQYPYQTIQDSVDIINKPDGIAFSSDGELLAVTSHGNHSVLFYQQIPGSNGLYTSKPVEILKGEETNFSYTHSVSFHPSDDYIAVSSATGIKTLSIFKKVSNSFPRYSTYPEQTLEIYNPDNVHMWEKHPEEGGVKGIAFSPDGKKICVCASDIINPDRMILIFPIEAVRK